MSDTIAAAPARTKRETEWQRQEAARAASVEPIAKLTRQYQRGLLTKREYFQELYRVLEDMGAPEIVR